MTSHFAYNIRMTCRLATYGINEWYLSYFHKWQSIYSMHQRILFMIYQLHYWENEMTFLYINVDGIAYSYFLWKDESFENLNSAWIQLKWGIRLFIYFWMSVFSNIENKLFAYLGKCMENFNLKMTLKYEYIICWISIHIYTNYLYALYGKIIYWPHTRLIPNLAQ